jgi:hypothetical protein
MFQAIYRVSAKSFCHTTSFSQVSILCGVISLLVVVAYWNSDRLLTTPDSAARSAVSVFFLVMMMYTAIESKDGLLYRPHPMVWRIIHGLSLAYFITLVVLFVVPPEYGVQALHFLMPDAAGGHEKGRLADVSFIRQVGFLFSENKERRCK